MLKKASYPCNTLTLRREKLAAPARRSARAKAKERTSGAARRRPGPRDVRPGVADGVADSRDGMPQAL